MKKIFITGAVGFLGSYLLRRFLDDEDIAPIILARQKKAVPAAKRVEDVLRYFYGSKYKAMFKRVKIVEGDVSREDFGFDAETKTSLIGEIDEIYHSAAIAEFRIPLDKIRKVNVAGAENVMKFALECKNGGRLKKMNHISTTFVAGTMTGTFHEDQLDVKQKFNNTYEQSKFESELVAHKYMKKGLDVTIFRPSILTGDASSGRTSNFKMLYQPLHFFASELFDAIPADRDTRFNLIPVDSSADAIYKIANTEGTCGETYHIANFFTVTAGHFIDMASDFFGFKKPEFIPLKDFDMDRLTPAQKNLIGPYVPYFNYKVIFDVKKARGMLEKSDFCYPVVDDVLLTKLFKFCIDSGFIKPKRQYVACG